MNKNRSGLVIGVLLVLAVVGWVMYFMQPTPKKVDPLPQKIATKTVVEQAPVIVLPPKAETSVQAPVTPVACTPCCCFPCEKKAAPVKKAKVEKSVKEKATPVVVKELPKQAATSSVVSTPGLQASPPLPVAKVTDSICPSGWTLIANAWSLQTFPEELRRKTGGLMSGAGSHGSYRGDAVSRTIGGALRQDVKTRATVNADVRILYRNPKTLAVVKDLGILKIVSGTGSFSFPDDPRDYVVETIWPATFTSPSLSMGERRLWIFPDEWAKFCSPNVHGIVP